MSCALTPALVDGIDDVDGVKFETFGFVCGHEIDRAIDRIGASTHRNDRRSELAMDGEKCDKIREMCLCRNEIIPQSCSNRAQGFERRLIRVRRFPQDFFAEIIFIEW